MDLHADDTRALLTLALTRRVGQTTLHKLIKHFGSPAAALNASPSQLAQVDRIGTASARKLHGYIAETTASDTVDLELEAIAGADAWLLDFDEPEFPASLKLIHDPPRLLWGRGRLEKHDAVALAIVGSRDCTPYGREQAERFARAAADAGLTIVSGGAYGVDAAAHEAVLKAAELGAPARTIAVIGSGLADPYPAPHAKMFDAIVASGSAVLSELPMHAAPRAQQFPARNRIIAGLSLGVLVIEAARRSGALITARLAADDYGRECMALPGRVDSAASAGSHELIRKGGATLVTHPDDVLEQLGDVGRTLMHARDKATSTEDGSAKTQADEKDPNNSLFDANLTPPQQRIVAAANAPQTFDDLLTATGLEAGQLRTELTMLELRGALHKTGSTFVRRQSP
ncbi:MAG: DNA-processing protein DprA [Planctomycetota bacterium]